MELANFREWNSNKGNRPDHRKDDQAHSAARWNAEHQNKLQGKDKKMELHQIVMKLNGPVRPVGETHADSKRLENLRQLTKLVDRLLGEIDVVAKDMDRPEASIMAAGKHAQEFLNAVRDA